MPLMGEANELKVEHSNKLAAVSKWNEQRRLFHIYHYIYINQIYTIVEIIFKFGLLFRAMGGLINHHRTAIHVKEAQISLSLARSLSLGSTKARNWITWQMVNGNNISDIICNMHAVCYGYMNYGVMEKESMANNIMGNCESLVVV